MVGCLTSHQQASVSQGRICSDNFTCSHTEIEVAVQTFYLTQSQYTDTGPTSPSAEPYNARRLAGQPLECQFFSHRYDSTPKKSRRKRDSNPGSSDLEADALTIRPTRRYRRGKEPRELQRGSRMHKEGTTENNNAKGLAHIVNKNFTDYRGLHLCVCVGRAGWGGGVIPCLLC